MDKARTAAVDAVWQFFRNPENGSAADRINYYTEKNNLDARDAAFASRLYFTALENERLCGFYFSALSRRDWKSIPTLLRSILLVGAVQILFFTRVPDAAAVNTSVEICRQKKQSRACPFINALLRRLSREKQKLPAIPRANPVRYFSILYSHPDWLVERLLHVYRPVQTERILKYNNSAATVTLQINSTRCSTQNLIKIFEDAGISYFTVPGRKECLILERTGPIEKLPGYREGFFYIQDDSCRRSVEFAELKPGYKVWDACAAPGGKSIAAALSLNNEGYILSTDLKENKIERIQDNAKRLGLSVIHPQCWDAKDRLNETFDCVLADMPCSGTGVISKRPEIRYKSKESIHNLPAIQREILDSVAASVRSGGILLYMTCSLLPEENEENIIHFLDRNDDFILVPLERNSKETMKTFIPGVDYMDGFFVCKLKRIK